MRHAAGAGILDAIDGALRDWDTSGDAMRWSPRLADAKGPAVEDGPGVTLVSGLPPAVSLTGPEGPWIPLGSFRGGTPRPAEFAVDLSPLVAYMSRFAEALNAIVSSAGQAAIAVHGLDAAFAPRRHRRCLTCHPERKPKPLAVDGREYQRRLRNRRKKRRR